MAVSNADLMITRSGCTVITTCSPGQFDRVKSLGASASFDYRDPDCGAKVSLMYLPIPINNFSDHTNRRSGNTLMMI